MPTEKIKEKTILILDNKTGEIKNAWDFKDGKVISGGDYMDAGGLMNSLKEIEVVEEAAE